jgi:hypothetical protein
VHFEPADGYEEYSRPNSRFSTLNQNPSTYKNSGVVLNNGRRERYIPIQREDNTPNRLYRQPEWQPSHRQNSFDDDGRGVIIMENPIFSNY